MKKDTNKRASIAIPLTKEQMAAIVSGTDQALNIRELRARLRLKSDGTVYEWVKRGYLPKPRRMGRNSSRWLVSEIAVIAI